jgi:hypothetical protein
VAEGEGRDHSVQQLGCLVTRCGEWETSDVPPVQVVASGKRRRDDLELARGAVMSYTIWIQGLAYELLVAYWHM